jgi:RNA polymerase primary sigma factor
MSEDALDAYLRRVAAIKRHPEPEEERKLLIRFHRKKDMNAFNELFERNLALVIAIARKYAGRDRCKLMDMISVGNDGLRRAIELFDLKTKSKLSTYAGWWIKQKVIRFIPEHGNIIRVPAYVGNKYSLLERCSKHLSEELGREPSDAELSEETGISTNTIQTWRGLKSCISLDAPLGTETEDDLHSMVPDPSNIVSVLSMADDARRIHKIVSILPEKERHVIHKRFGLGCKPQTLEQIGTSLGVTRERVRQIESAALKKLRGNIDRVSILKVCGLEDSCNGSRYSGSLEVEGPMEQGGVLSAKDSGQHASSRVQRVPAKGSGGLVGEGKKKPVRSARRGKRSGLRNTK